jgi:hypothetical protein
MSLEAAIRELNENVIFLTKALATAHVPQGAAQQDKAKPDARPVGSTSTTSAAAAPGAYAAKSAAEVTSKHGGALTYETDVKPIALALSRKSRPALLVIWQKLGVNVGTELKPEQLAEAKKLIEAASK